MTVEIAMSESNVELALSSSRWKTLGALFGIGLLIGFGLVFLGIVNLILTRYLELEIQIVDWFTLSNAAAQVAVMAPIGIYAAANPLKLKFWLLAAPSLLAVAFACLSAAILFKKLFWVAFIGMMLIGISDSMFRASVPMVASAWFSDTSQGKVTGTSYAFLGGGSSLAAIVTIIFLSVKSYQQTVLVAIEAIAVINVAFCGFSVILVLLIWRFVQDCPPCPPSRMAAVRVIRYSAQNTSFKESAKRFLRESKILLTDKNSVFAIISYALILATLIVHNLMLPPIIDEGNGHSYQAATKDKTYLLICFSVLGTVGSVASGAAMDCMKTYKPVVFVMASSSVWFSVFMFLGYYKRLESVLYVSIGMYGLLFLSLLPLLVDILKQHARGVHEVTQSIYLVIMWNVLTITLSEIYRVCIAKYGGLSFYVCNVVVCSATFVLLMNINPFLNRYVACDEDESLQ